MLLYGCNLFDATNIWLSWISLHHYDAIFTVGTEKRSFHFVYSILYIDQRITTIHSWRARQATICSDCTSKQHAISTHKTFHTVNHIRTNSQTLFEHMIEFLFFEQILRKFKKKKKIEINWFCQIFETKTKKIWRAKIDSKYSNCKNNENIFENLKKLMKFFSKYWKLEKIVFQTTLCAASGES